MTTLLVAALALTAAGLAAFAPRLLLVAFPLLAIFSNSTRLPIPVDDLAMVLLYSVFLFRVFPAAGLPLSRGQSVVFRTVIVFAAFLLFVGLLHVFVTRTGEPGQFVRETFAVSLRVLFPFVVARLMDDDTARRTCISAALALGMVFLAHAAAIVATGQPNYLRLVNHIPAAQAMMEGTVLGQTVFLNSNDFSRFVCVSLVLIALGAHLWHQRSFPLWALAGFAVTLISAASRSGALVSAWIAVYVYTIRGKAVQVVGTAVVAFVAILGLAAATGVLDTIEHRFSAQTLTQDSRTVLWREASRIVGDNPLIGVGPARFQDMLTRSAYFDAATTKGAHNNFLFIGAQYGVGAAALYIATIAAFALYFLGNAVHGRGEQRIFALYGLLALSVLFAFGMVAAVITKNYFFFALGVMLWGTARAFSVYSNAYPKFSR